MSIYDKQQVSIPLLDSLPNLSFKEKIAYLAHHFLVENQVECPVEHAFEGNKYIRTMTIAKDTLFIGRPHRHGHKVELLSGSVIHITQHGRCGVEAPFSMHTTPGYQTVFYTLTDIVGRTTHPCGAERDIQKLEDDIFHSIESVRELGLRVQHALLEGHT